MHQLHLSAPTPCSLQAVVTAPSVPAGEREAANFLLLPRDAPHDKVVLPNLRPVDRWEPPAAPPGRLAAPLPAAPEAFLGRNVETYRVVSAILDRRLVSVVGPPGTIPRSRLLGYAMICCLLCILMSIVIAAGISIRLSSCIFLLTPSAGITSSRSRAASRAAIARNCYPLAYPSAPTPFRHRQVGRFSCRSRLFGSTPLLLGRGPIHRHLSGNRCYHLERSLYFSHPIVATPARPTIDQLRTLDSHERWQRLAGSNIRWFERRQFRIRYLVGSAVAPCLSRCVG
eukprot:scaffold121752_cov29-Tisochrysis_lutea.AAC.4